MQEAPTESDLLEGLNDEQLAAVTSTAAPLCILAAAGSGKTRVLTRRIAYRCATDDADARHVLALTFTRKAAGELQSRVRALGLRERVTAGTFHAVAYAQLRQRWAEQHRNAPGLLDRKGRVLGPLLPRGTQLADAAGEIEWAKARLIGPSAYADAAVAAGRRPPLQPPAMAMLYQRYEDDKRKRGVVDFDDLLWLCTLEIERDTTFAGAQRWRFRHLFVDEFQDVNPLQLRLLEAWRGGRDDLCVVGDPNQAIYGWNGADATALTQFEQRYPGGSTVALPRNYRSSPQVLTIANRILDAGALKGLRLHATRADGPLPTITSYPTDLREAHAIARMARDANGPGAAWSHQAVLTRTNAQAVVLAEALGAAGIPARVRGQAPFLELPEVRDALKALQRNRLGLEAGLAALEGAISAIDDTTDAAAAHNQPEALPDLSDAELDRLRNLEELVRLAGEYTASDSTPSAPGFVSWLTATFSRDDVDSRADAVTIATVHAAKGLEWPIVYVTGLEEGLFPIFHAKTRDAVDEERRLFYVAVTRAERVLHLSYAEQRGGRSTRRRPSPYLDELEPVIDAMQRGATPADAGAHLPRARAAVQAARGSRPKGALPRTLDPADRPLFEALKQWRAQRSRAAAVPAFVVFDDKTLVAIASTRPSDQGTLLSVPGIGPTKLERFGGEVLDIVAQHSGA